jgi:hypothetical protein
VTVPMSVAVGDGGCDRDLRGRPFGWRTERGVSAPRPRPQGRDAFDNRLGAGT